jgi:hypothetical protein
MKPLATNKAFLTSAILGMLLASCSNNGGQPQQTQAAPPATQEQTAPPPAQAPVTQPPTTQHSAAADPPINNSTQGTGNTSGKRVTIEGKSYNCTELFKQPCGAEFATAFDKWGDNVDTYVNSGKLGPLGNPGGDPAAATIPYETIAFLGLYGCMMSEAGYTSKDFIAYGQKVQPGATGTELLPFWFQAQRGLCPEVTFSE